MDTRWFRHLKPEDQENFKNAVLNSTTALSRLREILTEELDALDKIETTDAQFSTPNWENHQAYRNGQRSKLRSLLSLLNFDPK